MPSPKLPTAIVEALTTTGLPWRAAVGGKHLKIYVGDRFIGVISHNSKDGVKGCNANMISRIRKLRDIK